MRTKQVRLYWEHLLPDYVDSTNNPPTPKNPNIYDNEWVETVVNPKMQEFCVVDLMDNGSHRHNWDDRYTYRDFADQETAQSWVDYISQAALDFHVTHPDLDSWRYHLLRYEIVDI